jgi:hypothetical protein
VAKVPGPLRDDPAAPAPRLDTAEHHDEQKQHPQRQNQPLPQLHGELPFLTWTSFVR